MRSFMKVWGISSLCYLWGTLSERFSVDPSVNLLVGVGMGVLMYLTTEWVLRDAR